MTPRRDEHAEPVHPLVAIRAYDRQASRPVTLGADDMRDLTARRDQQRPTSR